MLIQAYRQEEIRYAWCYRLYLRWQTYRRRPQPSLARLDQRVLDEIGSRYGIHVLECHAEDTDVRLLLSLRPDESVSACASKLKGQISKWLRTEIGLAQPQNLLCHGYFASTTGNSTSAAVEEYLSKQGEHHGYSQRPRPPVFVKRYELTTADERRLRPQHAHAILQHHIVLATSWRKGVFVQDAGAAVADQWRRLLQQGRGALLKVSFVPDHVHAAIRVHPGVSPAALIVRLMNAAQETVFDQFDELVIRAGIERLWQPSVYLGSYGDLASPQVSKYVRNWKSDVERE